MTPGGPSSSLLWEARDSRAALLSLAAPTMLLAALFCGVGGYFLRLALSAWLAAAPRAPQLATVTVQMIGSSLFMLVSVAALWVSLWPALVRWRRRYALGARGIEMHYRGYATRFPLDAIERVTIGRIALWRRIRFRLGYDRMDTMLLSRGDADQLAAALDALGVAHGLAAGSEPVFANLEPDETVRWQGQRGFAGFDLWQLLLPPIVAVPPLLFGWALWSIWSGHALRWWLPPVQTFFLLILFGPLGIGPVLLFGPKLLDRLFGRLVLTDRRLVWRTPWSARVYREVARADIVDAVLVEHEGARGWIGLSVSGPKGMTEIELKGVPDPDGLVAALGFAR